MHAAEIGRIRCQIQWVTAVRTITAPTTRASSPGRSKNASVCCQSGRHQTTTTAAARQRLGPKGSSVSLRTTSWVTPWTSPMNTARKQASRHGCHPSHAPTIAIRVTSPSPIASRPSAREAPARVSQMIPPDTAMPASDETSPRQ